MASQVTYFHTDETTKARVGEHFQNSLKFGHGIINSITIFLPDGTDAQPVADAFNAIMEAAYPPKADEGIVIDNNAEQEFPF